MEHKDLVFFRWKWDGSLLAENVSFQIADLQTALWMHIWFHQKFLWTDEKNVSTSYSAV